jgi:hypothetical protein
VAGLPLEHVLEAEQDDAAVLLDGLGEQLEHTADTKPPLELGEVLFSERFALEVEMPLARREARDTPCELVAQAEAWRPQRDAQRCGARSRYQR